MPPLSDDEFALLTEIAHAPRDHFPRLVYADWLDERGDVRGEFLRKSIRIEELLAEARESGIFARLLSGDESQRTASDTLWEQTVRGLAAETESLLNEHRRLWNGTHHQAMRQVGLPNYCDRRIGPLRRWDYRGGVPEILDLDVDLVETELPRLRQVFPVRGLIVRSPKTKRRDLLIDEAYDPPAGNFYLLHHVLARMRPALVDAKLRTLELRNLWVDPTRNDVTRDHVSRFLGDRGNEFEQLNLRTCLLPESTCEALTDFPGLQLPPHHLHPLSQRWREAQWNRTRQGIRWEDEFQVAVRYNDWNDPTDTNTLAVRDPDAETESETSSPPEAEPSPSLWQRLSRALFGQ